MYMKTENTYVQIGEYSKFPRCIPNQPLVERKQRVLMSMCVIMSVNTSSFEKLDFFK